MPSKMSGMFFIHDLIFVKPVARVYNSEAVT